MEGYTLTQEGRARFRRMEIRAHTDASALTNDLKLLHYLYEHGAASVEEIEDYTGLSWSATVNEIASLMNRGYIEGLPE
jgi:DNA-binding MarR family transcriptional regulator